MFYLLFMKKYWTWKIVLLFILGNLVGVVHCGPYNPSDNSKKTLRTRLVAIRSGSAPRGPSYVGAFWGNTILQCSCILFYSIFLFAFHNALLHIQNNCPSYKAQFQKQFESHMYAHSYGPKATLRVRVCKGLPLQRKNLLLSTNVYMSLKNTYIGTISTFYEVRPSTILLKSLFYYET